MNILLPGDFCNELLTDACLNRQYREHLLQMVSVPDVGLVAWPFSFQDCAVTCSSMTDSLHVVQTR